MSLTRFAWDLQVRRELLDEELARLRDLPYTVWCGMVSAPVSKTVVGRDNRPYHVHVSAAFEVNQDIRVTLSLARPRGLRRRLLRQTFLVTPDNAVQA